MKRGIQFALLTLACAVAACSSGSEKTVTAEPAKPKEVPEIALRELAAEIEQIVARGDRKAEPNVPDGLSIASEELRQAIRTRAARREVLDAFLDTGHAAEKQDGLIHVLRSKEYKTYGNRRVRDRNAMLIISENRDRWTLYEGLIDENRFPRRSLDEVRQIFTEARIVTLQSGQRYENREGEIVVR